MFAGQTGAERPVVVLEGRVSKAPADVSSAVYVTSYALGARHEYGPAGWQPRVDDLGAVVLPTVGDEVAFVVSDSGVAWLVGYWPGGVPA